MPGWRLIWPKADDAPAVRRVAGLRSTGAPDLAGAAPFGFSEAA
jgi:hypothetical protein